MKKILVIEDEEEVRSHIIEMLQYEGFDAIGAENGRKGIMLAQEQVPDLIVCDISMPEVNGYVALAMLRKTQITATIPFIFLTARTGKQTIRKGMHLGANDYLTKPFEFSDLLATIRSCLSKKKALQQEATKRMDELRLDLIQSLPLEMRTPLTGIIGFTQYLIDLGPNMLPSPKEIIDIQTLIRDSAFNLQHLIENYLLYANLKLTEHSSKGDKFLEEHLSMQSTHTLIKAIATRKAQEAEREKDLLLALDQTTIKISSKILEKIVTELLDNALKFTDKGKPVRVMTMCDHHQFVLRVSDQGQGMSQEQIARIGAFMQFERQHYAQPGMGLGLALCQLLVQIHQAEMTIESKPQKGTTVTVSFKR